MGELLFSIVTLIAMSVPAMASGGLQITARLDASDHGYQQYIRLDFEQNVPLQEIAAAFGRDDLIQLFNRRVKSAQFVHDKSGDGSQNNLHLTVGGFGFYFEHVYHCRSTLGPDQFERTCEQIASQGNPLLKNSSLLLVCRTNMSGGTSCLHTHTGVASKFSIPLIKTVTPFEMGANLFFYEVGYLAQTGLHLLGVGQAPKQVKELFQKHAAFSWYKEFEKSVDEMVSIYKKSHKTQVEEFSGLNLMPVTGSQSFDDVRFSTN